MNLKSKLHISLALVTGLVMAPASISQAYPTGSGEVGQMWGVVTGSQSRILITARGIAELDGQVLRNQTLRVGVQSPTGFSRSLFTVRTNSNGEYQFRVGGLQWRSGTYKVTVTAEGETNTLAIFVSSKRVRG